MSKRYGPHGQKVPVERVYRAVVSVTTIYRDGAAPASETATHGPYATADEARRAISRERSRVIRMRQKLGSTGPISTYYFDAHIEGAVLDWSPLGAGVYV